MLKALRAHLAEGEADIAAGRFEEIRSPKDIKDAFARIKRARRDEVAAPGETGER